MAGGTVSMYRVMYHFEQNGKKTSADLSDYVSAADTSYNTIKTILTNNGCNKPGTLVVDSVLNFGVPSYIA